MRNNTPQEPEMPAVIVGMWIRKLQIDGRLPSDFMTWRSICGSTIAELLDKAEDSTAHLDPSGDHKSECVHGLQEHTNDGIS